MKKIMITESQAKRLVENVITEQKSNETPKEVVKNDKKVVKKTT